MKERCENFAEEFKDSYKMNLERGTALKSQGNLVYNYIDLEYCIADRNIVINSLLPKAVKGFNVKEILNFDSREVPSFNGKIDILADELQRLKIFWA